AEILTEQFGLGIFVEKMVLHHVYEVRRFTARYRTTHQLQRRALGILNFPFIDVLILEHLRQDAVAGLRSALRAAIGRGIVVRCANNPSKKRALGQRKLAHVLAEISDACFREAADAKAPAIAQIHFVCIQLENLLLRKTLFEFKRNHSFSQLAAPCALIREEKSPRYLHGDRAGALIVLAGVANVGPRSADNTYEIETAMLEESFVFGGKKRVHQSRGQVVVTHRPALFSRAVKEVGD